MEKFVSLLFSTLFVLSAQAENVLWLVTYNICNARGVDNSCDYQRVADVINSARPNVAVVQELNSMTTRSNGTDVLQELAKCTQLYPYFAPAIDYDGGKYGIGLLAKKTPLHLQTFVSLGHKEARTLTAAEFPECILSRTHPSSTEEDRMKLLEILKPVVVSAEKPLFLIGGFNPDAGSDFIRGLKNTFQILSNPKQLIYSASEPKETLDYLVALKQEKPTFVVSSVRVIDEPLALDHRPLLVEVWMAAPEDRTYRTKPYLQNPVGGGIIATWQANVSAYCWVEYGIDPSDLKRARTLFDKQTVYNNTLHKTRLDSSQLGRKYYYRAYSQEILLYQVYKKVFGNTARTELKEFASPANGGDNSTAVVFNDLHGQSKAFQALCSQIKGVDYDFIVSNDDCVDDPANHDQITTLISELTEGAESDRVPVFLMQGNHKIRDVYSIGLHSLFDHVDDKACGVSNWRDARTVMLDCGEDKSDDHWIYYGLNNLMRLCNDQVGSLKKELASKEFKKAGKRILIHHILLYDNDYKNLCSGLWGRLLEKAPFNVCLNAHIHEYVYHPRGSLGNNFPVIIGGGYSMRNTTVTMIEKKKDVLKAKILNTQEEVLLELTV